MYNRRYYAITGDFRMKFAENPRKVQNIVSASFDQFKQLYAKSIKVSSASIAFRLVMDSSFICAHICTLSKTARRAFNLFA
jgi:Phosphatidate cytidylyltransferase, mitochondrial